MPCIYAEEFAYQPHLVFLSASGVVCVSTEKARNCYAVLVFDSKVRARLLVLSIARFKQNTRDTLACKSQSCKWRVRRWI